MLPFLGEPQIARIFILTLFYDQGHSGVVPSLLVEPGSSGFFSLGFLFFFAWAFLDGGRMSSSQPLNGAPCELLNNEIAEASAQSNAIAIAIAALSKKNVIANIIADKRFSALNAVSFSKLRILIMNATATKTVAIAASIPVSTIIFPLYSLMFYCFKSFAGPINCLMGLPLRALFLGALLSIVVSMYSAFAGLKIGGVYWPAVTVTIISMALLNLLGKTSKNEINVMQTAASAGGLLAGGLIFTVPAIWLLGLQVSLWDIFFVSIVGGLTGIIFSLPLRREMVEKEKLPFPEGTAVAAIIDAGDKGGQKAKTVFAAVGIGALFSILRDYFAVIPSVLSIDSLKTGFEKFFSFGTSVSLIPFAGGYLIGPVFTGVWFAGAVLSNFFLIPYLVSSGAFADKAVAAGSVAAPLGIGLVVGAAIAYFVFKVLPRLKTIFSSYKETGKNARFFGLAIIFLTALLTAVLQLNIVISVIAIFGAFAMAYIGARVTGEMNVDPMELFAMIVLLAAKIIFGFNAVLLVLLAAVVCISAGIAGDLLQDLKAGYLLGTNPTHQFWAQTVGVLSASLVIGLVLFALNSSYTIGSVQLPAPQAVALSAVVSANALSTILILGIVIGFIAAAILNFVSNPLFVVAFGIGVYVPIALSFPLFVGGILRLIADKKKLTEQGRLLAAGAIAGEGFIGVALALIAFAATFF